MNVLENILKGNISGFKTEIEQILSEKLEMFLKERKQEISLGVFGYVNEGKNDYKIYHNSYTSAIEEVGNYAKKNGYEHDSDEIASRVGSGPSKPSEGKTNRFSVSLKKDGKEQKKQHHFQVYGMGNGKYELNQYIS